jgi:hypothetical protein
MYNALMFLFAALAVGLLILGRKRGQKRFITLGLLIGVLAFGFFALLDFWGELYWFQAVGYAERFWITILAAGFASLAGLCIGLAVTWGLSWFIPKDKRGSRIGSRIAGGLIGLLWGFEQWQIVLKFLHAVNTGTIDPIFGQDVGFYLFSLPMFDAVQTLLLLLSLVMLAAGAAQLVGLSGGRLEIRQDLIEIRDLGKEFRAISVFVAFFLFVLALKAFLGRYHLLYSNFGVVDGAGWTDAVIRRPMYWLTALSCLVLAVLVLWTRLRSGLQSVLQRRGLRANEAQAAVLGLAALAAGLVWFLGLNAAPKAFQWLRVEPNEITYERPYIENNIAFTRKAFKLNQVEERQFPVSETFTSDMVERNTNIFENIRLWDWRALDAVYQQFQEIRLYYEFRDVDIDRYTFGDSYREVMVSAREMELNNLPEQSQTFVNRRFKYTHGYGIAMNNVSQFTEEGLPKLLIKDIPPKSLYPELEVSRPEIYYGELTETPVVVNTTEMEFDYPRGEENAYIRYPGQGGVQLSNLWRKFLYGWKFDGTKFFLSNYPTEDSRVMFHRQIRERLNTLAPFIDFDDDPYIVLADGQLYWIVDGYTSTDRYPYSEPFSSGDLVASKGLSQYGPGNAPGSKFIGQNYVRNSVKAVVNAFSGEVDFYVFDQQDPLIQTWQSIFDDLLQPREAMPEALEKHIRYPSTMLLIQGLVYAKYHMDDPAVFYNQEDLWVRATEKYHNRVQPVEPYYVMWERPNSDEPEFVLILPFTPKNRQVLIGWIAGMCDPGNYGRLLSYKFPKDKRVLGPQQVETKIDQDSYLSGQLTLWDQRGSNVIRGNVLAIPLEDTLFYVEPIYLQAETAAYPELRLVVVMHNDRMSYAESFDKALRKLFEGEAKLRPGPGETRPDGEQAPLEELIRKANQAFESYLQLQGKFNFQEASKQLDSLHQTLQELSKRIGQDSQGSEE